MKYTSHGLDWVLTPYNTFQHPSLCLSSSSYTWVARSRSESTSQLTAIALNKPSSNSPPPLPLPPPSPTTTTLSPPFALATPKHEQLGGLDKGSALKGGRWRRAAAMIASGALSVTLRTVTTALCALRCRRHARCFRTLGRR